MELHAYARLIQRHDVCKNLITFQFVQPSQAKYIKVYEAANDTEVLRLGVSQSPDVFYPTNPSQSLQLSFHLNYTFVLNQVYYILIDEGIL